MARSLRLAKPKGCRTGMRSRAMPFHGVCDGRLPGSLTLVGAGLRLLSKQNRCILFFLATACAFLRSDMAEEDCQEAAPEALQF